MRFNGLTGALMDIKQQLKALLQEAETYRTQGLIAEAHLRYTDAADLIKSIGKLKNRESLLSAISEKIQALDSTKQKVDKGPTTPELSKKAQDLIKNLFAFSENKDKDSAALEGAVALAKFGQFDRAVIELNELLQKDAIRVEAAKNILRCHLASTSPDEAVAQYRQWFSDDRFQSGQLETVRTYLDEILQKRGIEADLPSAIEHVDKPDAEVAIEAEAAAEMEEEFLDITSIGITFDSGPRKGKIVEFDVNFQSGNMLSLIISKQEQELIESLSAGMKLQDVQYFSPIAIFNGAGLVTSKTQIKAGPKQGDFCLDVRIVSSS
jgi:tetratricopeptide (TPR) repeat protein